MDAVDGRRADIRKLVKRAMDEARSRNRRIETIDPLVRCARRLFPYAYEETLHEYARMALRIIRNGGPSKAPRGGHQTTLPEGIIPQERISDDVLAEAAA